MGWCGRKNDEKTRIFQKKSGKCFVVKKKAVHLHSLYNGNSATNDDRLFSSVGQSTWFVISGSLVRIRQEAQRWSDDIVSEAVANAFSEIVTKLGQIPEWPNGADCKSAVFRLRWFESIFAHMCWKRRMQTGFDSVIWKYCLCLFANSLCKKT